MEQVQGTGPIPDPLSASKRPSAVETRAKLLTVGRSLRASLRSVVADPLLFQFANLPRHERQVWRILAARFCFRVVVSIACPANPVWVTGRCGSRSTRSVH